MIRAVIFDFFGVVALTIAQLISEKYTLSEEQSAKLNDLHKSHDHGFISEDQFLDSYALIAGISRKELSTMYYSRDRYHLSGPVLEYISELRTSYKIGLLSNVSSQAYHKLIEPLISNFDEVVTSYSSRMAKPDVEIYAHIAEKLGVDVAECIMIDDSELNCEGARTAGMLAVHYENIKQCRLDVDKILKD